MKFLIPLILFDLLQFIAIAQALEKPHIFLILTDDMNDYPLDVNGHPQVSVPGMNEIAAMGTSFLNAHTSSPKCAPSRTSMITGKDLLYTNVYYNPACLPFRDYFTAANNNEEVFTIPEHLKNNGYFTYGINKLFHCFSTDSDFDSINTDPCSKELSWSKYSWFKKEEDSSILIYGDAHNEGMSGLAWSRIPDSLEYKLYDHRAVDSALNVIDQFYNETIYTCGNPLFITIGLRRPHLPWYVPEKYFTSDYVTDFYAEPFNYPYNNPENQIPFNGVVMPPQPDTIYNDYNKLGILGQSFSDFENYYYSFDGEVDNYSPLPEFDPLLSEEERLEIMYTSIKAQATIGYLAAISYVDAQVKRFIDSLQTYPEIFNNSILIFVSDHGFSLGEKRHWNKGTMWEDNLRVPFIIADMRNPVSQSTFSAVSLLDLFPTICDLTEIPYPTFEDGSDYLDGKSLMPLLNDPDLHIDKPALASHRLTASAQCSCFPQYSIRNNAFHYIYYTSNNADTILDCNDLMSWHEEELYEIGEHFQTDPNEWNNLINDSAYLPVKNYLQQWLPDSAMYLRVPYSISIQNNAIDCFMDHDDTLELYFNLYDTTGNLITPPENYIYSWSNNITNDIFESNAITFPISLISEDVFNTSKSILFVIQMIDTTNNIVAGIDTRRFFINPANEPAVSFSILTDSFTVFIEDIILTGNYNTVTWHFGDGNTAQGTSPAPYTYTSSGPFTITCTVAYGNDDTCEKEYSITTWELELSDLSDSIKIYPNPANDFLHIKYTGNEKLKYVRIINMEGRAVFAEPVFSTDNFFIKTDRFPAGHYLLQLTAQKSGKTMLFEVVH